MSNKERRTKILEDGIRDEFKWAGQYEKHIDSALESIERYRAARKECLKKIADLQAQLDKLNEVDL